MSPPKKTAPATIVLLPLPLPLPLPLLLVVTMLGALAHASIAVPTIESPRRRHQCSLRRSPADRLLETFK